MPHRTRPLHSARHPVHVTLRSAFRPLRHPFVFPTLRRAILAASRKRSARSLCQRPERNDFRVVHFSVQGDHLHLLVEARDKQALSNGMRGLSVSIARRLNALVRRRGRVFADRWHGRALTTPRAVRHALVYVLANHRKHGSRRVGVDPYSSAPYFSAFRGLGGRTPLEHDPRSVPRALALAKDEPSGSCTPRTWLLRTGWAQHSFISISDAPSGST